MRGRKRQRKKDAKKRGIWGAPVVFTAKRRHEQPMADMLTKFVAHKLETDREAFYAEAVQRSIADMLASPIPRVSEWLRIADENRWPQISGEWMDDATELQRCQTEDCGATLASDGTCPACENRNNPEAGWNAWVESRPEPIRSVARRLSPRTHYRMATTGDDYYLVRSFCEDGTVKVLRFSAATQEPLWEVFGVDPDELIPWRTSPWSQITPN